LYGGGDYMLAEKLTTEGVPTSKTEARAYIDTYNKVYYRVRQFRKELLEHHEKHGYVKLLTGRRRHLADVDWSDHFQVHKAETTLSNNVVQGSGQDMLKASIIRCDPYCPNVDAVLPQRMNMPFQHRLMLRDYARKVEKLRALFKLAKAEWIIQVHDEVVYFVDYHARDEVAHKLAEVMTWKHFFPATTSYNIPLVAEGGIGLSWKHAKSKTPLAHFKVGI
jgi:DNA polymerase I-like protein with 3'-5' exonuclease and polymerase domains